MSNKAPKIHQQDMGPVRKDKTNRPLKSLFTKILPGALLVLALLWYANAYFDAQKADEFIDIYNPNVAIIADDMTQLSLNFQKAGEYLLLIEQNPEMDENEAKKLSDSAEVILSENTQIYERVYDTVETIETNACTQLEYSQQECLDFIGLYRDMIDAFQTNNYDTANTIGTKLVDASNKFVQAVKQDNIDFQAM